MGQSNYDHVIQSAGRSRGSDQQGYRKEFIDLVKKAKAYDRRVLPAKPASPYLYQDNSMDDSWNTQTRGLQFKGEVDVK